MSSISLETSIKQILAKLFNGLEVSIRVEEYKGKIHAFFIRVPDEKLLETDWEKISNSIAVYYQGQLDNEFEIWNLYLFYITQKVVQKHLKYKIENDTVSSRKILLGFTGKIDEEFMSRTISEHITNKDLDLLPPEKQAASQKTDFVRDPLIWKEIQASGMMDNSKNSDTTLQSIEAKLKNEIQKS